MKLLIDTDVRYYEFVFSKDETLRFLRIKSEFNEKNNEGEHDPSDAVRLVKRDSGFVHYAPSPKGHVAFVVKGHLANEWDDEFYLGMTPRRENVNE